MCVQKVAGASPDRWSYGAPAGQRGPPPGRGDNVFVLVSHSHHKTSRLWTLAQDIISEWEQRKKRRVGGGGKTVTLILFYLLVFFHSLCEEANAAGVPGVPDRRAVDGSPCQAHKTHALVPVSCSCCPITFHKSEADRGRPIAADPGRCAAESCGEADRGCAGVRDPCGNRGACRLQASGNSTGGRAFSVPQILEQSVEVVRALSDQDPWRYRPL